MKEGRISLLGGALVAGLVVSVSMGAASCGTAFSARAESDAGPGVQDSTAVDVVIIVEGGVDETNETGTVEGAADSSGMDVTIVETGPEAAAEGGQEASSEAGPEAGPDAAEAGSEAGACSVTGQSCVPAAPAGWTGPVQFYYGAGAAPGCPTNTTIAFTGGAGLNAPPATCSTCTCGAPSGESCTTTIQFYNDTNCGVAPCSTGVLSTTCNLIGAGTCDASAPSSYTAASEPTGGQCAPSPETPTVPPFSWSSNAAACTGNGAASPCGSSGECVPAPASGFQYCVYTSGDVPCPSGSPYSNPQVVYGGATSSRSCTACTCGGPAGQCAGGTFTLGKICPGSVPMALPLACSAVPGTSGGNAIEVTQPTLDPGTCTPEGGTPTGSVTPTSPISVCCGP